MKGKIYFGNFGGMFVPETLLHPLQELEKAFFRCWNDKNFRQKLRQLLINYAGRPTPLYYAQNLSRELNLRIYLKREDLLHTGAHKINNALAQALLAVSMKKKRVIAETGAGQHGVATATACALLGLKCVVYMGRVDVERQANNVKRMRLLGAEIKVVETGSQVLKDAVNEALRDWVANFHHTYYLLGSTVGPFPYPLMVRNFQSVIGEEAKKQIIKAEKRLPDILIACVGGGSNSLGLFHPFFRYKSVKFIGVEAAGEGLNARHAASLLKGKTGILHGAKSYLLQDRQGQVKEVYSLAPGLDYPGAGPEHAWYKSIGRAEYVAVTDQEAIDAVEMLSRLEGIIPALESAHALAYLRKLKLKKKKPLIILCLSGRGDKDLDLIEKFKH